MISVMLLPYISFGLLSFLSTLQPSLCNLWAVDLALSFYNSYQPNQAPTALCTRGSNGLNLDQKNECFLQPDASLAIAEGAVYGLQECSRQLSNRRWNCPHLTGQLFKNGLQRNTKETAYVQAITSAGIVYSIARACSREKINQCSCDNTERTPPKDGEFQWGGCGDNLQYGYNYARRFSGYALSGDASSLLNGHNSEAGRLVVTEKYKKECYCHGISGSCSVKTCWVVTPTLEDIGRIITHKYSSAVQVVVSVKNSKATLIPDNSGSVVPSNKNLVYTEGSPNHCERNQQYGSEGTVGRECDRKHNSIKNCDIMCCNRGYRRKIVTYTEECNCKFVWCCRLECEQCTHVEERYYCK